jgi:DNA-binding LacI/PurR family transcriptional regulator
MIAPRIYDRKLAGMPDAPRGRGRPPNSRAIYRRIQADVRRMISSGKWARGQPLPSLRSLAERYRVGKCTVNLAMAGLKEDGWVAASSRRHHIARLPESGTNLDGNLVLEVLSSPLEMLNRDPAFRAMQAGINDGVGKLYAPLLIVHDADLRRQIPDRYGDFLPRGILLYGRFKAEILKRYEKMNLPVVLCDIPGAAWKLHSVSVANADATHDAVLRLANLGHRRIAFVQFVQYDMGAVDVDSKQRKEGYLGGMKAAGLNTDPDWIYNSFATDTPRSQNIQRLLRTKPAFTAVICADATRASWVIQGAQHLGKHVPRDLSVVGFQGDSASDPALSGPRTNFEEMGRTAIALLREPIRQPKHFQIQTRWSDGETVAEV